MPGLYYLHQWALLYISGSSNPWLTAQKAMGSQSSRAIPFRIMAPIGVSPMSILTIVAMNSMTTRPGQTPASIAENGKA